MSGPFPKALVEAAIEADLRQADMYWRAANYLAAGQIYLMDNALLRRSLVADDIKPRLLGHWGTSPGLRQSIIDARLEARRYGRMHGEDPPEIAEWRWDIHYEGAAGD
jgi:xylulose-5-phosphate/fructose-6-phosphate phosphoketolase